MRIRMVRLGSVALAGLGLVWACGFDNTLREYLSARFWLPFAKRPWSFAKPHIRRMSAAYAGMTAGAGNTPLDKLRTAYQQIAQVETEAFDEAPLQQALAVAKGDGSLTPREREEVSLIDAKIDMRAGLPEQPEGLQSAKKKLETFLRTARTPQFASEARGWLARVHYLLGERSAAGKIYLDELNRNESNLTQQSLLNSLRILYGYDGGEDLLAHLEEYFDTPEHAAFAITLVTNPHWWRPGYWAGSLPTPEPPDRASEAYGLIRALLEKHADLLRSNTGANALALLTMRTALRMGDVPEARKIAEAVAAEAEIRSEPDFNWMSASAYFLSREYAAAEEPLLALFRSPRSSKDQKAAAAYGLCGVYRKTGNAMEQIRFALWLHAAAGEYGIYTSIPDITDLTVYWNGSGWDLAWLLDAEAPLEVLQAFVKHNPGAENLRVVQYALAVRLTREDRYDEAADLYDSIHAIVRGPRTRQLAALYRETKRGDQSDAQRLQSRYKMAEFLSENPNRIYFNDNLWHGFQSYSFLGAADSRLTRAERDAQVVRERKLKDDQEELWRAYLILRDVVRAAGKTELGRRAATLGVSCLRRISDRFGREEEIRLGDIELSAWLRR